MVLGTRCLPEEGAASDAVVIDSTHLSIEQTIEQVLGAWQLLVSVGGGPRQTRQQ